MTKTAEIIKKEKEIFYKKDKSAFTFQMNDKINLPGYPRLLRSTENVDTLE